MSASTNPASDSKKPGIAQSISQFKPPPDPNSLKAIMTKSKRRSKVLDEDEYVKKVEDIIERDFFPELDKLNAQSEYLEAAERKDEITMNRLREKFSSSSSVYRKVRHDAMEGMESPATFETPQETLRHGDDEISDRTPQRDVSSENESEDIVSATKKPKMSLDKFLQSHTSEDNESFQQLMSEAHSTFQRTHSWMFKADEQLSIENKSEQLKLPSIESQAAGSDSKHTKALDGWTYKNVNTVFYHPEGAPLTEQEKIELAKKEKQILHENTRFRGNPWKSDVSKTSLLENAQHKKEANFGKVGADGKELIDPSATPKINGYSMLRIADPSPMIPPSESPLMTWGEVESTPYRLEGCETPLPMFTGDGPSFKIQDMPKRDRLALELAEKNSKFYRDKKTKAIEQARSSIKTPKSVGNLSTRVATMSPAAQRLATSKLGIRLGTDKALKASYTPSPMHSSRKSSTPSLSTPLSNISSLVRTPGKGSCTPVTGKTFDPSTITDNLLNLPSSSKQRPRASDFMN